MKFEVKNGSFSYRKDCPVLKNVSFTVEQGEILSILGCNGAGKTTLLKCMLGFLKWNTGDTFADERTLESVSASSFWRKVSYVPQSHFSSFPCTVEETVLMGRTPYLSIFSSPGKKDEEKAVEAMKMCGILNLRNENINEISGGQRQLAYIARALCTEPMMIVLDEPETGLDYANQLIVMDLMCKLSEEKKITVIFNTHYPDHALDISDKALLFMKDGSYLFGNTEKIVNEENLGRAFGTGICMNAREIEGRTYHSLIPYKEGNKGYEQN